MDSGTVCRCLKNNNNECRGELLFFFLSALCHNLSNLNAFTTKVHLIYLYQTNDIMTVFSFLIFEGENICFSSCYIFYCLIHFSLVLTYQPLLPGSPNLPTQLPSRLYIIPPSAHLQVTLIVLPLSSLLIHLPFQPFLTVFLSASLLPSF